MLKQHQPIKLLDVSCAKENSKMIFFPRVFSELKREMKNIRCTALPKIQRTSIDKFCLGAAVSGNIYQLKRYWLFKSISLKKSIWYQRKCVEIIWRICKLAYGLEHCITIKLCDVFLKLLFGGWYFSIPQSGKKSGRISVLGQGLN